MSNEAMGDDKQGMNKTQKDTIYFFASDKFNLIC